MPDLLLLGAGLVAAAALLWRLPLPAAAAIAPSSGAGDELPGDRQLERHEVEGLALATIQAHGFDVRPELVVAIAFRESSFRPWVVGDDGKSVGLMQLWHPPLALQQSTALWLFDEIGYRDFPRPTVTTLKRPADSLYFGAAYLDWLRRYAGIRRGEPWMVQSYNAGPGNSAAGYLSKVAQHMRDFGYGELRP